MDSSSNTSDPATANCRVFVGNLNKEVTGNEKDMLHEIFQTYGTIDAISVHKGFAFVQFSQESEARSAVESENGRMFANQKLDLNVASEPKANQKKPGQQPMKRKPPPLVGGGRRGGGHGGGMPGGMMKRPRMGLLQSNQFENGFAANNSQSMGTGEPDLLVCGNCKAHFQNLASLVDHKRRPCILRFRCACDATSEPSQLVCALCQGLFYGSWPLIQHLQLTHNMNLYKPFTSGSGMF